MKILITHSNGFRRLTNHIRMCGELACLLEVSATPKPGNVHRFRDFKDVRYEDFLASSVSFGSFIEELAMKGFLITQDKISWEQINLGSTIQKAISSSSFFHKKSNTNLGIILLLSPLCVAAGMCIDKDESTCNIKALQTNAIKAMNHTTVADSIAVSRGIVSAKPGGLGKVEQYDVNDPSVYEDLRKNKINLLTLMEDCSARDNICFELARGYPITFDLGLPTLHRSLLLGKDINLAIIDAYLAILSEHPDTLISRKFGKIKAQEIAMRAKSIIELGGALTIDGRRELEEFDIELREEEEKVNPGTSADLIASTLFVYLLSGGKFTHH